MLQTLACGCGFMAPTREADLERQSRSENFRAIRADIARFSDEMDELGQRPTRIEL